MTYRKSLAIAASVALALPAGGCAHQNAAARTLTGAGVGAAVGGIAGAALGGNAFTGAVTGAVVGGVVGAAVKGPIINGRQYYRDSRGYCYYVDRDGQAVYSPEAKC
ncbi:MAG: hypothetical protein ABR588_02320 [Sphingomicrobium sp.]|nr:hypothetical protein [Sphingomonadales bacterium]